MTEDPPEQEAGAPPEAGPAAPANLPPLMIGAQYIKDLSFENPQGPEILATLKEGPQVNVEVNTSARNLGDNVFEVTLFIRGEARSQDKPVFIVELTYGGIVTVNNLAESDVRPALLIEAARHLFPFAREVVANVTRDGGFPPLMINPLDFAALYQQQHGAEHAEAAPPDDAL